MKLRQFFYSALFCNLTFATAYKTKLYAIPNNASDTSIDHRYVGGFFENSTLYFFLSKEERNGTVFTYDEHMNFSVEFNNTSYYMSQNSFSSLVATQNYDPTFFVTGNDLIGNSNDTLPNKTSSEVDMGDFYLYTGLGYRSDLGYLSLTLNPVMLTKFNDSADYRTKKYFNLYSDPQDPDTQQVNITSFQFPSSTNLSSSSPRASANVPQQVHTSEPHTSSSKYLVLLVLLIIPLVAGGIWWVVRSDRKAPRI